ncbi:MAG: DNA polymerase IV [Deltaproteobacteria bacterium]|nr:DNA polymerase IV [Deltaproteobacteria bacterium]
MKIMDRVILHIDMDAFYASVEQVDDPRLMGKPVIVGGTSRRGVVSAASYEARKFGVHSAMPMYQARKCCPCAFFLPVRMGRYLEISGRIMDILHDFSPLVEQVSIDEAYMDLTGTGRLLGRSECIGSNIKKRIREETSLTCSIGIAPNKFLAKIASEMDKPDGLEIIRPWEINDFIDALPLGKVPGIGEKTLKTFHDMKLFCLGDIKKVQPQFLTRGLGRLGERIIELSKGIDNSRVIPYSDAKSISSEDTLPHDTHDISTLKKNLIVQSGIVGKRLRKRELKGSTINLKVKYADFKQITRRLTLDEPTNSTQTIYNAGINLLHAVDISPGCRLIGIGVSNLISEKKDTEQLALFKSGKEQEDSWKKAEKAIDIIKERFGDDAIKRGVTLKSDP